MPLCVGSCACVHARVHVYVAGCVCACGWVGGGSWSKLHVVLRTWGRDTEISGAPCKPQTLVTAVLIGNGPA